jgi:hypothetical protein
MSIKRNSIAQQIHDAQVAIDNSAPNDPATNVITVDVTVQAADAGVLNLYTKMMGSWTITSSVSMKQEDRV